MKRRPSIKLPIARIKRIVQTNEDVGKVASKSTICIAKACELFLSQLISRTCEISQSRDSSVLTAAHLKECINTEPKFDFLVHIVANVADAVGDAEAKKTRGRGAKHEDEAGGSAPKAARKPRKASAGKAAAKAKRADDPEDEGEDEDDENEEADAEEDEENDDDDDDDDDDDNEGRDSESTESDPSATPAVKRRRVGRAPSSSAAAKGRARGSNSDASKDAAGVDSDNDDDDDEDGDDEYQMDDDDDDDYNGSSGRSKKGAARKKSARPKRGPPASSRNRGRQEKEKEKERGAEQPSAAATPPLQSRPTALALPSGSPLAGFAAKTSLLSSAVRAARLGQGFNTAAKSPQPQAQPAGPLSAPIPVSTVAMPGVLASSSQSTATAAASTQSSASADDVNYD